MGRSKAWRRRPTAAKKTAPEEDAKGGGQSVDTKTVPQDGGRFAPLADGTTTPKQEKMETVSGQC
jgi:hypothetical protein